MWVHLMVMKGPLRLDIALNKDTDITLTVNMTGPHHVFKSGKTGYTEYQSFEWDHRRWGIRFQAFVTDKRVETTHGLLSDVIEMAPDSDPVTNLDSSLDRLRKRVQAGWELRRRPDGIHAIFDHRRLRTLPSGKIGTFASFNVEVGGVLYFGQLRVTEMPEPMTAPTERDWSKGAKAGLPTLGKRR